ncbi:MAG: hypothetical protein NDJ24_08560 [Alphaproteobacteria bacterium]|nr:hypothetical protein [Alphaproteobacteria bacterium]
MGARLISFIFDEPARACIEQCPQNHPDGHFDQDTYDNITQLNEASPLLNQLPEGTYALVIQADPRINPFAQLTLIDTQGSRFIAAAQVDLRPIITSAIDDGADYSALIDAAEEDEGAAYEQIAYQISLKRSEVLENLFKPYIESNPSFNLKLLDALDYLVYPVIVGQVAAYNLEETAQIAGTHQLQTTTPKLH